MIIKNMRKQFVLIVLMALSAIQVLAHTGFGERPKLVVGIILVGTTTSFEKMASNG